MVTVRPGKVRLLTEMLSQHPRVRIEGESDTAALEIHADAWHRSIHVGQLGSALFGLVELMDNNPLVCADAFSLPTAGGTLALVGLGPVIRAGTVLEPPVVMTSFQDADEAISLALASAGWGHRSTYHCAELDLGTCLAATCMAAIETPENPEDLDALYDEAFGRSFYVRRLDEGDWDTAAVAGKPYANYRLRYTPGDDRSLLTIQVMADRDGKCGAAQIVHAMNVMCGFEETLGIPEA